MKKVIFSTAVTFDSHKELVQECINTIVRHNLEYGEDSGVHELWGDSDTWTDDVICEFLKYQGSRFYEDRWDFEDAFNDEINEVNITIKS